jgi:hypothetical protein
VVVEVIVKVKTRGRGVDGSVVGLRVNVIPRIEVEDDECFVNLLPRREKERNGVVDSR